MGMLLDLPDNLRDMKIHEKTTTKQDIARFVKLTKVDGEGENCRMYLAIPGNEQVAQRYLSTMRTKLSTLRQEVRKKGSRPKSWKMINEGMVIVNDEHGRPVTVVTIARRSGFKKLLHEIDQLLLEEV